MIPYDYITEWRGRAPWVDDAQVEQDLVISRALIEIFSNEVLHSALAFRGGTALFKLHLPPARYSEDIDLVQVNAEPAGPVMAALNEVLNPGNRGQTTFSVFSEGLNVVCPPFLWMPTLKKMTFRSACWS